MNKNILTGLNLLILVSILILPALILASAYNVAGVASSIKLADPKQSFNGGKITVSSILSISNPGPFDVNAGFNASIRGSLGTWVGVTGPKLLIAAGSQERSIPVEVEIDLSTVSEDDVKRLAFNSENFTLEASISAGMPPITSLGAKATAQVTWLPPLHNFTIGTPAVRETSPTQITLEAPISFENQSPFFAVNGAGVIRLFDSTDHQVGEGVISISAQPKTKWSGTAQITVSLPTTAENLLLKDETLRFRAETDFTLTDYSVTLKGLNRSFELGWGALIKDPKVQTSYTPVNSTHTRVTGSLSFINNNSFLKLYGTITPKLVNSIGDTWVGNTQSFHLVPGGATILSFEVVVPNSQLLTLRLVLGVETAYGSFDLEAGTLG